VSDFACIQCIFLLVFNVSNRSAGRYQVKFFQIMCTVFHYRVDRYSKSDTVITAVKLFH
jgi:hypothetical protein